MNLAIKIMTGLVRTGYWGGWALMRQWPRRESDTQQAGQIIDGVSSCVEEEQVVEQRRAPEVRDESLEGMSRGMPSLGQAVIRYGDGYSVVCRCYPEKGKVARTLWLNYIRLQQRYGAWTEQRLRLRAGGAVAFQQALPHQGCLPTRPWGRIELSELSLTFTSLQDQALIALVDQTVDESQRLIDAEVPDGLLAQQPWQLLPEGPVLEPTPAPDAKTRRVVEMSLAEVRAADARRKTPLATTDKVYPNLVKAPEVRCYKGVLMRTGFVERSDAKGRKSRSFFAEVRDEVRSVRHTGTDLQRALLREDIQEGDQVEVFAIGLVPQGGGKSMKKIWSVRKVS